MRSSRWSITRSKAYLAQSPQFYKQMMVGSGLERVFEVGHAYRRRKAKLRDI